MKKALLLITSVFVLGTLTACERQEYTGDKEAEDCTMQADGSYYCEHLDMRLK